MRTSFSLNGFQILWKTHLPVKDWPWTKRIFLWRKRSSRWWLQNTSSRCQVPCRFLRVVAAVLAHPPPQGVEVVARWSRLAQLPKVCNGHEASVLGHQPLTLVPPWSSSPQWPSSRCKFLWSLIMGQNHLVVSLIKRSIRRSRRNPRLNPTVMKKVKTRTRQEKELENVCIVRLQKHLNGVQDRWVQKPFAMLAVSVINQGGSSQSTALLPAQLLFRLCTPTPTRRLWRWEAKACQTKPWLGFLDEKPSSSQTWTRKRITCDQNSWGISLFCC